MKIPSFPRAIARACARIALPGVALLFSAFCAAAPITIPNATFSDPANNGQIGGGLIGGSGSGPISSGPWGGAYFGVVGVLAPPALTISSGRATVSGLAGVDLLGIVNNGGDFDQLLTTAYAPNHHYVLNADVDGGHVIDAGVLNSGNAGIALFSGSTVLASSIDNPNATLVWIGGTTYRLTLTYDSGATAGGNIGVQLFAHPQNLTTSNLLTSISFGNVTLSGSALNPVPAGIAPASGTPQGATINTAFAAPFVVGVIDSEGDPVPNATVTFAAPASGASAQLSATTVHTGVNGLAQVTGIANGTAGNYAITASVSGVAAPANFNLTNLAGVASAVASAGGTPQSATVNTAFGTPLGVTVTDAGSNPVSGITVAFSAPSSGASATFAGDGTAITDGNGHAQINATANTVAGNYNVTAHVNGAPVSASFALTNAAGPAYLALPAGGTPQSATVLTSFAKPLSAKVTDAYGNPISGVMITFTAPASGASATFPPGATTTITVTTDANGMVQVNATANSIPGSYDIVASGTGLATSAVFHITNSAGATPQGSGTSGNGQGANVLAAFQCLLQIKVTSDGTTPLPGVSIDFVAPGSGPSAVLSNGITSGTTVTTITDTNGLASATATANNIAGTYAVSAGVTGSGAALASYTLTNFSAGERLFATGFETLPATCSGH